MTSPALDDTSLRHAKNKRGRAGMSAAKVLSSVASTCKMFVIDDEFFSRHGASQILEDSGYEVEEFSSCESFLEGYRPRDDTCIVLDAHFPYMSGLELIGRIRGMNDPTPVIIVSGASEGSDEVQSMKQAASDFLAKPVARDTLLASVRKALNHTEH